MLLLTVVPLVELYLLVRLTQLWGSFLLTVGLIVGTGLLGATLARLEGLRVISQVRRQLQRGELPTDSLLDGMMILVAAALLVTPGLLTDAAGFLLLIPYTRKPLRGFLKSWIKRKLRAGEGVAFTSTEFRPVDVNPPEGFPPLEEEDGS